MDKEAPRPIAGYREEDMIYGAALDRVRMVIAWYNARIYEEGHAARLDSERITQLESDRRKAMADRRLLDRADDSDIRRIHQTYGELFLRLQGEEAVHGS